MILPAITGSNVDWNQWANSLLAAGNNSTPLSGSDIVVNGTVPSVGSVGSAVSGATSGLNIGSRNGSGITGEAPQAGQFGLNIPTFQAVTGGLQSLAGIWNGFQQMNLAKKAFNFQRDYANTNLRNQTQSYNTQMEDRINSRAAVQGMSAEQAQEYLNRNRLSVPSSLG